MKRTMITHGLALTVAFVFMSAIVWAQGDKASRPSPPATTMGKVDGASITIIYSSPAVKGRKIWGGLVPYGKAWRAGANEATIFTTDKSIKVEGTEVPAGKYSLFAIPGEYEWTIILNSETGQWGIKQTGEANYDSAKDVVFAKVKPLKAAKTAENLTYSITTTGFKLHWENVEVPVVIK